MLRTPQAAEVHTGFWSSIDNPIIGLAPMDGVSDAAFRSIVATHGRPSLVITEFTSVEGIRAGALRLLDDFLYSPAERPVLGQIFGADPEAFFLAAVVVSALGFDGIDINMGCPAKNVTGHGAGAALILDPERAKLIIKRTRAGTQAWRDGMTLAEAGVPEVLITEIERRRSQLGIAGNPPAELPISVKTRLGYSESTVEEWVVHLLECSPVNITLHGRTLKQLYTGTADWDAIARGARIIHETPTLVIGNGDVSSRSHALELIQKYDVDGALIGRASFGNPWIFNGHQATLTEKLEVALEHARLFNSLFPPQAFVRMRKHLLDYVKGFEGAKELRTSLMRVISLEEVESLIEAALASEIAQA